MSSQFTRKNAVLLFFGYSLVTNFANGLTVTFVSIFGWNIFVPKAHRALLVAYSMGMGEYFPIVVLLQNIAPFIIILIISLIYIIPVILKASQAEFRPVLVKRVVQFPLFSALVSIAGWCCASLVGATLLILSPPPQEIIGSSIFSLTVVILLIGILIGILVYYGIEFINLRYTIPKFFSSGEILDSTKTFKLSIRIRFILLYVSLVLLPLLFLNIIVYNSRGGWDKVFYYSLFFAFVSFLITASIARLFREPLERMDRMTRVIQKGDYSVQTEVLTGDELGRLSNSLNNMAKGLAEREKMKDTFGKVVDPVIRDHLLSGNIDLGGVNYTATVLFTDIRNFTTISEQLSPDILVSMLNRYFSEITAAITEEGGLVNKFIGDAVMALFGVPVPVETHGAQAIRAAKEILRRRDILNKQFVAEGLPEFKSGIGIHTGNLIAGNIGSKERMEFTAIGDTVNVAARLESSCKELKQEILFSDATRLNHPSPDQFQHIGSVKVKGRNEPVIIYTV